jgi:hypothetical protein
LTSQSSAKLRLCSVPLCGGRRSTWFPLLVPALALVSRA